MRLSILLCVPLAGAMFIPIVKDAENDIPERVESSSSTHRPFGIPRHQKAFENLPASAPGKLLSDKPPFNREQTSPERELEHSERDAQSEKSKHRKRSFFDKLKEIAFSAGNITQKQRQAIFDKIDVVADKSIFVDHSTEKRPAHLLDAWRKMASQMKDIEWANEPIKKAVEPIDDLTPGEYGHLYQEAVGRAKRAYEA